MIAILASFLMPALSKAKGKAKAIHCLNNSRQLTLAWMMYPDDHQGWFSPNDSNQLGGWVSGFLDYLGSTPANTNIQYLTDSPFAKRGPYTGSADIYKCPSDRSEVSIGFVPHPRVRSYSMNFAIGNPAEDGALPMGSGWRVCLKSSALVAPSPANHWVTMDEHPDSVDDGSFLVDLESTGQRAHSLRITTNAVPALRMRMGTR